MLGGVQSTLWHGTSAPEFAQGITALVAPHLLAVVGAVELAQPGESYFVWGRSTLLVYALLAPGLFVMARQLAGPMRAALWFLVSAATVGDLLAYWLSQGMGPAVRRIGFWHIELPALVLLAACLSLVGLTHLCSHSRAGPAGLRLAALSLPLCLGGAAALQYLPHGLLVGLGATNLLCLLNRWRTDRNGNH